MNFTISKTTLILQYIIANVHFILNTKLTNNYGDGMNYNV